MKYLVEYTDTVTYQFEVEADDPEHAKRLADPLYDNAPPQDGVPNYLDTVVYVQTPAGDFVEVVDA